MSAFGGDTNGWHIVAEFMSNKMPANVDSSTASTQLKQDEHAGCQGSVFQ